MKLNKNEIKERKFKRNAERGFEKGNSKYALKIKLQHKGIFSANSPFRVVIDHSAQEA